MYIFFKITIVCHLLRPARKTSNENRKKNLLERRQVKRMKGKQMTGCWAKFTVSFSALLPVSRPAVLRKKGHGAMK
jgi:hypothetical protein